MQQKKKAITTKRAGRWVKPPLGSILRSDKPIAGPLTSLKPKIAAIIAAPYEVEILTSSNATSSIELLRGKALAGDADAVLQLHSIAVSSINALDSIASKNPNLLRAIASDKATWPTLYSQSSIVNAEITERLKAIGFASKSGASWIPRSSVIKSSLKNTADSPKVWVYYLINFIQTLRSGYQFAIESLRDFDESFTNGSKSLQDSKNEFFVYHLAGIIAKMIKAGEFPAFKYTIDLVFRCSELPDLSPDKATLDCWWRITYELLMLNTNGQPESLPNLHAIGCSRENHYSALKVTEKRVYLKPDAVKANVRAKIFTEFHEELERLAKQLVKAMKTDYSTSKG